MVVSISAMELFLARRGVRVLRGGTKPCNPCEEKLDPLAEQQIILTGSSNNNSGVHGHGHARPNAYKSYYSDTCRQSLIDPPRCGGRYLRKLRVNGAAY